MVHFWFCPCETVRMQVQLQSPPLRALTHSRLSWSVSAVCSYLHDSRVKKRQITESSQTFDWTFTGDLLFSVDYVRQWHRANDFQPVCLLICPVNCLVVYPVIHLIVMYLYISVAIILYIHIHSFIYLSIHPSRSFHISGFLRSRSCLWLANLKFL